MEQISHFFINHKPQCIFFLVFMVACLPVLYYYRKRNPNPRFRPTMGEMSLMTVFCAFVSGGLAAGLGGVFNEKQDFRNLAKKPSADIDLSSDSSIKGGRKKEGDGGKKDDPDAMLMKTLQGKD